ncbi:hypothetical protein [Burkholderia sp. S-53]|uniref:hypothetical protein n=1 Tax=Burkholderia sp. S-53 TaxID=2906514 RepID=UPI0021D14CCE|nr:hypothetical protein [Burkholderia sp. S-53]UXU87013.1 hypothetical protein LXM88_17845 [Burkholderia sp. S-53]
MLDVDVTSAEQAVPLPVICAPDRYRTMIACVGTGPMLPKQAHCVSGRLEEWYVVDAAGSDARKID